MQIMVQVYLPSCMFVIVSWVSFLIKPDIVPGRMALLIMLFLVLINIFNVVKANAPVSAGLNAVDIYLVACIILVFAVVIEYAVVLYLLKTVSSPTNSKVSVANLDEKQGDCSARAPTPGPRA